MTGYTPTTIDDKCLRCPQGHENSDSAYEGATANCNRCLRSFFGTMARFCIVLFSDGDDSSFDLPRKVHKNRSYQL